MFLLTGNSRQSLTSLRSDVQSSAELLNGLNGGVNVGNGSNSHFTKVADPPVKPGELNANESLKNLLDCCILYYYAVAHKYIIMVNHIFVFHHFFFCILKLIERKRNICKICLVFLFRLLIFVTVLARYRIFYVKQNSHMKCY